MGIRLNLKTTVNLAKSNIKQTAGELKCSTFRCLWLVRFIDVCESSPFCSPRQKYSEQSHIVKYYYNFK